VGQDAAFGRGTMVNPKFSLFFWSLTLGVPAELKTCEFLLDFFRGSVQGVQAEILIPRTGQAKMIVTHKNPFQKYICCGVLVQPPLNLPGSRTNLIFLWRLAAPLSALVPQPENFVALWKQGNSREPESEIA
jgi:hypothetical protein